MADHELPSGSEDIVQDVIDVAWRDTMRLSRELMERLRQLWPEYIEEMNEAGADHLRRALSESEMVSSALHKAGPHVLGREAYDRYVAAQTQRRIGA